MLNNDAEYFSSNLPSFEQTREFKIVTQPNDVSCQVGGSINLIAVVESDTASFQWYNKYGQPIPMQHRSNLFFRTVQREDLGFYTLEILDQTTMQKLMTRWAEVTEAKPNEAKLLQLRISKPILVSSSLGGSYRVGGTFELSVCFDNATAYQWYKDGNRLEGCTGNILTVHNANVSNTGVYVLGAMNSSCGLIVNTDPIKIVIQETE